MMIQQETSKIIHFPQTKTARKSKASFQNNVVPFVPREKDAHGLPPLFTLAASADLPQFGFIKGESVVFTTLFSPDEITDSTVCYVEVNGKPQVATNCKTSDVRILAIQTDYTPTAPRKKVYTVAATADDMTPTINQNDKVLFTSFNGRISPKVIYLVRIGGEHFMTYVVKCGKNIILRAANDDYEDRTAPAVSVEIVGVFAGVIGKC